MAPANGLVPPLERGYRRESFKMRHSRLWLTCLAIPAQMAALASPVLAQTPTPQIETLVTMADVKSVSGLTRITSMTGRPRDEAILASIRFFDESSSLVVKVNAGKPGTFVMDKAHQVTGVGDEAFESVDRSTLCFRVGNQPFTLTSGFDEGGETNARRAILSPEQLRALAGLILSRMQPPEGGPPPEQVPSPMPSPSPR